MSEVDLKKKIGLEALRHMVGTEIGLSDWILVDQAMIDGFADLTHDRQFIHTDPVRTEKETPFGGTIAHGFLTLALLSKMAFDALPTIEGAAMGVNYGFDRVRFLSPVPAGARIRGRFRLASLDEKKPGEVAAVYEVEVDIDGLEKPALAATWLTRSYGAW